MDVDREARKVTLTLKKGLIDSKLPAVTSMAGAVPGARTHGWVSGVTDKGIFVGFYNRVKGLVPPAEAPVPAGDTLADSYTVGQVLKVTIAGADPRKGLRLSLSRTPASAREAAAAAAAPAAAAEPGQLLRGATVTRVEPASDDAERAAACYLTAQLPAGGAVTCRLAAEHFSDHAHAADALAHALTVGATLPELVVLETRPQTGLTVVSRKACLLRAAAAGALPCDLADIRPGVRAPGFIASVTKDACFVRFGGGVTGRAGLPHLADAFVAEPASHFRVGQSVHAVVLDVVEGQGRFSVSLKPSVASPVSSELLQSLFSCAPCQCSVFTALFMSRAVRATRHEGCPLIPPESGMQLRVFHAGHTPTWRIR